MKVTKYVPPLKLHSVMVGKKIATANREKKKGYGPEAILKLILGAPQK